MREIEREEDRQDGRNQLEREINECEEIERAKRWAAYLAAHPEEARRRREVEEWEARHPGESRSDDQMRQGEQMFDAMQRFRREGR
ncbi:MAG: hypothetical protein ACREK8_03225 [Gemmatimonadales bacterium]